MDDSDKEFLNQEFKSVSHLFSYLTLKYGRSSATPVHVFVILPVAGATVERISEVCKNRKLTFDVKELAENLFRVTIGIEVSRVEGFLIADKDWWIFISRGGGNETKRVLIESFVKHHFFSVLNSAYIEPHDMIELVSDFSSLYDKIILEEFSMASERGSFRAWRKIKEEFDPDLLLPVV